MTETFDPTIAQSLDKLITQIGAEMPELKAILDSAQRGELSETEAMMDLMHRVQSDPKLSARFMDIAKETFQATRAPLPVPQPKADLAEVGDEAFWSGVGLPQLNPLVEAALAERAQFDGDMPELRMGPLAEGVMPAMPVMTGAKNPAAIGAMLEEASKKVRVKVNEANARRAKALERVAEAKALVAAGNASTALKKMAETDTFALAHSEEFDPPEYRRGTVPAPMAVQTPTGAQLIKMTPDEQRMNVWRFISTTQGRRTALETLRTIIFNGLVEAKLPVEMREYNPKQTAVPLVYHQWTVNLSGRGSVQPAFNIIDTAAKVLLKALAQRVEMEATPPKKLFLEVIPVDTVDIRKVGWAARLVASEG